MDSVESGIEELVLLKKKIALLQREQSLLNGRICVKALEESCDRAVPAVQRMTVLVSRLNVLKCYVDIGRLGWLAREWLADARAGRSAA